MCFFLNLVQEVAKKIKKFYYPIHAKNTIKYLSYTKLTTRVEFIETVIQITISLFFSRLIGELSHHDFFIKITHYRLFNKKG